MNTTDQIITLKKAAELLDVSKSTIYRLAESGELEAFRIRAAWRTSRRACDEYIRRENGSDGILPQKTTQPLP